MSGVGDYVGNYVGDCDEEDCVARYTMIVVSLDVAVIIVTLNDCVDVLMVCCCC